MANRILNPILRDEIRGGWMGVPKAFSAYDFLGAALGAYFIIDGGNSIRRARGRNNWALTRLGLGTVMVFIHTQRFFYAPQTRDGLVRLLKAVDVTPEQLCPRIR